MQGNIVTKDTDVPATGKMEFALMWIDNTSNITEKKWCVGVFEMIDTTHVLRPLSTKASQILVILLLFSRLKAAASGV